jgi:hypothetical protein
MHLSRLVFGVKRDDMIVTDFFQEEVGAKAVEAVLKKRLIPDKLDIGNQHTSSAWGPKKSLGKKTPNGFIGEALPK